MSRESANDDAVIARLVKGQHGVVSVRQLRAAGIAEHRVLHRARIGRLHRIHRGVYAVGHRHLSQEGRFMAAVLACGEGALSHLSAAWLWDLLDAPLSPVDVTIPGTAGRRARIGIHVHRSPSVPEVTTIHRGIPVTTPARTIEDLRRSGVPDSRVRYAIRQAELKHLALNEPAPPFPTRSDLEDAFLDLCRRHRIPQPAVNVKVAGGGGRLLLARPEARGRGGQLGVPPDA